jgi:hypothetical protein
MLSITLSEHRVLDYVLTLKGPRRVGFAVIFEPIHQIAACHVPEDNTLQV